MAKKTSATAQKPQALTLAGRSFEEWAAGRTSFTQEELLDIWAGIHGLRYTGPAPVVKAKTTAGQSFANWTRSRAKLTPEEIFDIEAQTQDLAEIAKPTTITPAKPIVKPGLVIALTKYPKWWKGLNTSKISLSTAGSQTVVPARSGSVLFISSIAFTVSGDTTITLTFGVFGSSGAMNFGGTDEPRGIVIAPGEAPIACGQGSFSITSDGSGIAVGGFASYYLIKE